MLFACFTFLTISPSGAVMFVAGCNYPVFKPQQGEDVFKIVSMLPPRRSLLSPHAIFKKEKVYGFEMN